MLLVAFVLGDILLSPLGFETRGPAILGNAGSLPWFGLLIGGLILNIVSLIVLFFRPHASSILALVGSFMYIIPLLGDQAGLIISLKPPPLITDVEIVTFVVLVATLFYASRVYKETSSKTVR